MVNDEKTSKTGRYQPRGGAVARSGAPEKRGTRGSSSTDSSGSAPAAALLEVRSQPVAAALARASEVSSPGWGFRVGVGVGVRVGVRVGFRVRVGVRVRVGLGLGLAR